MSNKKCAYINCKKEFLANNGNARYCCDQHYKLAKKERQNNINRLIKDFRKGIYKNIKTLNQLIPEYGHKKISLLEAKDIGFDEFAFYKSKKDENGLEWHCIDIFYFRIISENNQLLLQIYKPKQCS